MTRGRSRRAPKRVALYLRVSTVEQAKGHSLDSQRDTLREWARAEGWSPVSEYDDPGASGTNVEGRPGFRKMVADAEVGRFDAILVLKLDRFSRNRGDAAIYRKRLNQAGVALLSYNEPTNGRNARGHPPRWHSHVRRSAPRSWRDRP